MPSIHNSDLMFEVDSSVNFAYGTAGFRAKATIMEPIAYRMGLLAAALSAHHDGQIFGIMITASHNPIEDNGVKLVGTDGTMLDSKWESLAEIIANCPLKQLQDVLQQQLGSLEGGCRVVIGRDTRPSGAALFSAAKQGARILGADVIDVELVTTPEFHTSVARLNRLGTIKDLPSAVELEELYISELAASFHSIVGNSKNPSIYVDASNGIGAKKLSLLSKLLNPINFKISIFNTGNDENAILNERCGADHVKSTNSPPLMNGLSKIPWGHYASVDGDADRVVFFTFNDDGNFVLLDGDRIAVLLTKTLLNLLTHANLADQISIGIVQTAYANGSSTNYIRSMKNVKVFCTPTGVKHLHKAAKGLDIGIYFEANGHGTILFSDHALDLLRNKNNPYSHTILALANLANPLVGDALSDILLVEAMLKIANLSIKEWATLYDELPSYLGKVVIKDRNSIKTIDADRRISSPQSLQDEIDSILKLYPQSRAFVRPSGTENVVRIYAEGKTLDDAREIGTKISKLISSSNL